MITTAGPDAGGPTRAQLAGLRNAGTAQWPINRTSRCPGNQLHMPVISLDLYIISDTDPLEWRYTDLAQVIESRTELMRPVIVECVCLCQVLMAIDLKPDIVV